MTITPDMLTPEYGFEPRVLVEVVGADGSKNVSYFDASLVSVIKDRPDLFRNIHPLTGPMAIWNFAPLWANYYVARHDMQVCRFQANLHGYMIHGPHAHEYTGDYTKRPWWAGDSR